MRHGITMYGLALGLQLAACTRADSRDTSENREQSGAARRMVPPDARPPADARPGPPRVTHIAAGHAHTCALFESGAVRCWGKDANGRLGAGPALRGPKWEEGVREGRRIAATIPDVVLGGRAVQIAAGYDHTCALLDTGKVRCWGANDKGQLGYGYTTEIGDQITPALAGDVALDEPVTQVVAGALYTCALLASGRVRCWGSGSQADLGQGRDLGNIGDDEPPTSVPALDLGGRITQLSAGNETPCALLADGSVRCWGDVSGSTADRHASAAEQPLVALGARAVLIASGLGARHTCAITDAGRLRCWGRGKPGAVGYGPDVGDVGVAPGELPTPAMLGDVPLPGGGRVMGVAPGGGHTCVLLDTGSVRCWGTNWAGELGPASFVNVLRPEGPARVDARDAVEIDVGGRVVDIASGASHVCVLLDTGSVRCWGNNDDGQLGYGMRENVGEKRSPAAVGDVPL